MTNTLTAEQIAQGWKLVPNEATQDMLDAYYNAHKERFAPLRPAEIYGVMLAAAPLPPVSGEAVRLEWRSWRDGKTSYQAASFNGKEIGRIWSGRHLGGWVGLLMHADLGGFDTESEAIAALEAAARAWLSPLTNEPVGVTKPRCGVAGEISLPAMGLDYFYNPSDWEWTQNADDDSCVADWLSESMVDVMEIQTLIEGPLLFAANIPTKWDEDGEVTDSEVTYFDTEEDAKSALSAAIGEQG